MDDEKWDGTTWAGDVYDGEGVYEVKLHKTGISQLDHTMAPLHAQIHAEFQRVYTFMTIQLAIIVALLLILIF
jgi:hypothetical protein